jgi:hypothetical protein
MEKIVIILFPILGALMDGFQHEGKKLTASIFKTLFLGVIAYFLLLDLSLWYIVYLALCWWVLFDITYNITRKLNLFYVGTTKWTDKLLRLMARDNASHLSWILKLMAAAGIFALFYTGRL